MKYYLAIDIGASSGRHIVGWMEDGQLKTKEVFRFPNGMSEQDGHLIWDLDRLTLSVKLGIQKSLDVFGTIESLSIDTWGVDYVLMQGDQEILPCYAYRDQRMEEVIPMVHEKISFASLYQQTGIQFQPFNTIYQLYADLKAGRLKEATDFLMVPEYLMYKLCGVKSHEYTNATTTGLVNAHTGEYDPAIIDTLDLPGQLFKKLQKPGAVIGEHQGIRVMLCATHDTGSAVEGIPMEENAPYISSGTWSLLGLKTPKPIIQTAPASESADYWSNEGGAAYYCYQKTIMGMWLINKLRDEMCPEMPFDKIVAEAESSNFEETVDVNAPVFYAPDSMKKAFEQELSAKSVNPVKPIKPVNPGNLIKPMKPRVPGDYFRCAYRSLALCYRDAIQELEHNTGQHFEMIYIVGGGAKNAFLNRLTEEAAGKKVIALPIEATALGNLKLQIETE